MGDWTIFGVVGSPLLLESYRLSLQLIDTLKIIKKPAPRKSKIKIVDQEEKDATVLQATPPRTRMSTLKRDNLRKVLQSWIVWVSSGGKR
jgi:hypothetical protein